jgi:transposase
MTQTKPTIIELNMDKLKDVLRRAEVTLGEEDYGMIKAVVESYACLTDLVGDKNTTIARLRKMLFGAKTEKTAAVVGNGQPTDIPSSPADDARTKTPPTTNAEPRPQGEAQDDSATPLNGHGRNGADAYTGAEKIEVPLASLQAGDPCPKCDEGTVYETGRPGVLVRLVGQPPVGAKVYYLQKLRCNLCGVVFTAEPPEGAGAEKYHATVGSMVALLRYGLGMPMNRNEMLQESLGVPLPDATQWEIVADQADRAEPAFEELVRQAAQGDVVYHDDTTIKVLELMDQQALADESFEEPVGDSAEAGSGSETLATAQKPETERTGMFTTGIVAEIQGGEKIALFLSGRQHAGENLKDVLARRAADIPRPIQMCDALSRNMPKELKTLLGNCLAHGRRKFVEVAERFPEECRHVLESLSAVYRNDAAAKERNLLPAERLILHQADSGPIMEELQAWLKRQFDEHRVEPNSALGQSIAYMLRHWQKLTLFLRVAGAPLDNNICERALKMAIRHRKNSLFYRTLRGAHVGDIFMSLIHTCRLCGANPFDYLTELDRHVEEVASNAGAWMPWNYRQNLGPLVAETSSAT